MRQTAAEADAASLVAVGLARAPSLMHFLLGPGLMPAFNAALLGYLMYRSGLVPRLIPAMGLIGAPLSAGFSAPAHGWRLWSAPPVPVRASCSVSSLKPGRTRLCGPGGPAG
jgi:Domain of unknown function (DUF4386)